jgi:hypothetical protein
VDSLIVCAKLPLVSLKMRQIEIIQGLVDLCMCRDGTYTAFFFGGGGLAVNSHLTNKYQCTKCYISMYKHPAF